MDLGILSRFAIQRGWDRGVSDTVCGEVGVVAVANIKKNETISGKRTLERERTRGRWLLCLCCLHCTPSAPGGSRAVLV